MPDTHSRTKARSLLRDTRGAVAVEYGVLLLMVGVALLGMMSLTDVSGQLSNTFYSIVNAITG